MSIRNRLEADLKQALKARDGQRVSCIRMLKSRLLEREVALRAKEGRDYEVSDEEALKVIATYAKQRRDSIESYRQGGRDDLATSETQELEIVNAYLPKQLSPEEVRQVVQKAISETGATSAKDMGRVMKTVMAEVKGLADGKLINEIVRELLG